METKSPPKPMSDAQMRFMKKLAQEVTGDGEGYFASIQAKYRQGITSLSASNEIKHLQSLQSGARPLVQTGKKLASTSAPPGRYAVDTGTGPMLVEVTKPSEGRWAGYTFVKRIPLLQGESPEAVRGAEAVVVLNAIEEHPQACAADYGRITGRCGQCNRRLSDPQSVSMGIGPDCLGNFT